MWWIQAAQASYSGEAQHQKKGSCATIGIPTLDRLRLHSIMSYSIVWWIQAAQASYSGEAQHQKKGRCATIGDPTYSGLEVYCLPCGQCNLKRFPSCTLERDMRLQQFDGERVVNIHYHKGEQVSTRCVNESGCRQFKAAVGQT